MGDNAENTGVGTIERPWDGNNLPEMNKQKPVVLDGKQVEDDDIRWQAAIFYAVSKSFSHVESEDGSLGIEI